MKKRHSLSTKVIITMLVIVIPLAMIFFISYDKESLTTRKTALLNLSVVADSIENSFYHYIDSFEQRAHDFSSDGYIRSQLKMVILGDHLAASLLNEHLIKNKIILDKRIKYISVASLKGVVEASTDQYQRGRNIAHLPVFSENKTQPKIGLTIDNSSSTPLFFISTPLLDVITRKHIGMLINAYPLSVISDSLNIHNVIKPVHLEQFKSLDIYLINNDGYFLTNPRFIKDAILIKKVDIKNINACTNGNDESSGFYKNYHGTEVVGISKSLFRTDKPLILILEIGVDEALAPIVRLTYRYVSIGIIITVFIALSFFLLNRHILVPIKRTKSAMEDIAQGNLNISVPVRSSDEIGELSEAFNKMAINLKVSQKKLNESKRYIETIIQTIKENIILITMDGKIILTNESACQLLGYNSDELLNKNIDNILQLYESTTKSQLSELISQLSLKTETEVNFITKEKQKISVFLSIEKIKIFETDQQAFILIAQTITDREQTDRTLRESLIKVRHSLKTMIEVIAAASEFRDPYTAGHQRRTADLARAIAEEMKLDKDYIEMIHLAGTIHDIGKLGVPTDLLTKPSALSNEELALIKKHVEYGVAILKSTDFPKSLLEIILQHHERLNGSGYPGALQSNQITIGAKILAVANVIEACSSHRPYRPSLGMNAALDEIKKNKGVLYDPSIVDMCVKLFEEKKYKFP